MPRLHQYSVKPTHLHLNKGFELNINLNYLDLEHAYQLVF